ncbi:unnamed protein product [Didymodactylos carnosus]|uniref:Uncharacterized protein n=1 Tax=Didymodactylos carnosus TaxID=1234261 RepID=A0A813PDQ7_9BILA|nr:unnamed protein product [Didymodactylos carnosus]CAF3533556.1 unnamed protein product [Didymodactylos carnosus]
MIRHLLTHLHFYVKDYNERIERENQDYSYSKVDQYWLRFIFIFNLYILQPVTRITIFIISSYELKKEAAKEILLPHYDRNIFIYSFVSASILLLILLYVLPFLAIAA